jgi:hypothetical protein
MENESRAKLEYAKPEYRLRKPSANLRLPLLAFFSTFDTLRKPICPPYDSSTRDRVSKIGSELRRTGKNARAIDRGAQMGSPSWRL